MNLSDLRKMVSPYVARGDQFADDLHRLLTIIEQDFGLAPEPPQETGGGVETDPTATGQQKAVAEARQNMQTDQGGGQTEPEAADIDAAAGRSGSATVEPETVTGPVVSDQGQGQGQETQAAGSGA